MRLIQLDIMRAVAIFLVLMRHIGQGDNPEITSFLDQLSKAPFDFEHFLLAFGHRCYLSGWIGVDLFFVLSGYLTSGLLFQEFQRRGKIDLKRFFFRRGMKIFPSFYVFLAATAATIAVSTTRRTSLLNWICEALFIQNYGPSIWGHTWSLAVEVHFYLALGLFLYWLTNRRSQLPFQCLPRIFLTIAVVELLARIITGCVYPEFEHKTHVFPSHLRFDSLSFGVLLSYLQHFEPQRLGFVKNYRGLTIGLSLLFIAPVLYLRQYDFLMYTVGLTTLYIGFGGLLLVALSFDDIKNSSLTWWARPFAAIGTHSYSIYLWHPAMLVVFMPLSTRMFHSLFNGPVQIVLNILSSVVFGIVMAKLVEFPALRIRDALFPIFSRTPYHFDANTAQAIK